MKKSLLLLLGFLMLGLGAVGILLPVLPTTPFILVAATCFGSSSPRLYQWLIKTHYFGAFIENYRTHVGVPMSVKAVAIGFLWGMLILSAVLSRNFYVMLILAIVGIGVTIHIGTLKTKTQEAVEKFEV